MRSASESDFAAAIRRWNSEIYDQLKNLVGGIVIGKFYGGPVLSASGGAQIKASVRVTLLIGHAIWVCAGGEAAAQRGRHAKRGERFSED